MSTVLSPAPFLWASPLPLLLLLFLLLPSHPVAAEAPPTFSLQNQPEFNLLSGCGKECLYGSSNVWIGGRLGCSGPYTNDCMCRVDKAAAISSYASECNSRLCTHGDVQEDITTFLSLYNSYCAKNSYTLPGAAAEAGQTGGDTVVGDPTAATVTRVTYATATATAAVGGGSTITTGGGSGLVPTGQKTVDITVWTTVMPTASAGGEGSESGLSRSDMIALGVGIGIGLPSAIAGVWVCFMNMCKHREPGSHLGQLPVASG
ncbi:hypothetical protein N658DRAFT_64756 [Parathielavia hyrcaniae]|uniref:Extracellular membrane protein CFEM domain-containing protein n=1 Tax=Parathielavia hyrcaniae TaxID=113614 RepID=A0AAN6PQX0_9PEZI|nr:hypothetical protein N658DRAFT_64756 [Parathielavia hyrcaniae]